LKKIYSLKVNRSTKRGREREREDVFDLRERLNLKENEFDERVF